MACLDVETCSTYDKFSDCDSCKSFSSSTDGARLAHLDITVPSVAVQVEEDVYSCTTVDLSAVPDENVRWQNGGDGPSHSDGATREVEQLIAEANVAGHSSNLGQLVHGATTTHSSEESVDATKSLCSSDTSEACIVGTLRGGKSVFLGLCEIDSSDDESVDSGTRGPPRWRRTAYDLGYDGHINIARLLGRHRRSSLPRKAGRSSFADGAAASYRYRSVRYSL
eukprot:TRINITY_DN41386_c0_g1_i1.p1 TRINITY_DN41386_c0_g1~~TRINITY_DN41386_c0_g1_i1.p1  ORF type:complete len:243 (-),score=25.72 TRINITY_DN41386_c0_g1_i1:27-698(-)